MISLYYGDSLEIAKEKVATGSVDLIFTDPPYPKEYLYCYEWLASEAERVLKNDGFLIAYVGPYWKDEVMNYLNAKLKYFYDFILIHQGNTSILWPRKVISGYKSLLCYHKKGAHPLPNTNVLGKITGTGPDKRFHHWGQDENSAEYLINCFTSEGDLVVDYFLGAGTTAVVCKRINRDCIGIEKDEGFYNAARARVNGGCGPDEKSEQQKMFISGE